MSSEWEDTRDDSVNTKPEGRLVVGRPNMIFLDDVETDKKSVYKKT
jgi:hypothetical protein